MEMLQTEQQKRHKLSEAINFSNQIFANGP